MLAQTRTRNITLEEPQGSKKREPSVFAVLGRVALCITLPPVLVPVLLLAAVNALPSVTPSGCVTHIVRQCELIIAHQPRLATCRVSRTARPPHPHPTPRGACYLRAPFPLPVPGPTSAASSRANAASLHSTQSVQRVVRTSRAEVRLLRLDHRTLGAYLDPVGRELRH